MNPADFHVEIIGDRVFVVEIYLDNESYRTRVIEMTGGNIHVDWIDRKED